MTFEHPCSLQTQVLSFDPFLTDLSTASSEDSILSLACPTYQQLDIMLFSEQSSHQRDYAGHHIHLCVIYVNSVLKRHGV